MKPAPLESRLDYPFLQQTLKQTTQEKLCIQMFVKWTHSRWEGVNILWSLKMITPEESITVEEVMKSKEWKDAMDQELRSIQKHQEWKLVDLQPGKTSLNCKWVFRIKKNSKGNILRHKARLVICGYNQKYGTDYKETFSPVAKFDSIRSILSIAAKKKMKIN